MIYVPKLPVCDECDRLAIEFEQALEASKAAAADAQESAENASTSATEAKNEADRAEDIKEDVQGIEVLMNEILAEAREILDQIRGAGFGRYSQTFTTIANQSEFNFDPQGYEYSVSDYYSVYVNGLKLRPDEFTRADNVVTLVTPISLANQKVEIVAETSPEES